MWVGHFGASGGRDGILRFVSVFSAVALSVKAIPRQHHGSQSLAAVLACAAIHVGIAEAGVPPSGEPHPGEVLSPARIISDLDGELSRIVVSDDSRVAAVCGESNQIELFTISVDKGSYRLAGHTDRVRAAALTSDGNLLMSTSDDHTTRLWDLSMRSERAKIGTTSCLSLVISPDNRLFASGHDNEVRVGDVEGLTMRKSFPIRGSGNLLAFSKDEVTLGVVDYFRRIWFLDTRTAGVLAVDTGHRRLISSARFIDGGRLFVTGSLDHHVKVWNAASGRLEKDLHEDSPDGCLDRVYAVGFEPARHEIVTYAHDNYLRVWSLGNGRIRERIRVDLRGDSPSLRGAACFSSNNEWLIVGTRRGTLLCFDLRRVLTR
jgi:WD40 repeat protein